MKSLYLRSAATGALALACAVGLGGCGGSAAELSVSGSISGLSRTGLVLQNNGGPDLVIPASATSFTFPELIAADEKYNVTVKAEPKLVHCTVTNGSGRSAYNVSSVVVSCVTESFDVIGKITGLTGQACVYPNTAGSPQCLVLNNGPYTKRIDTGATTFNMTSTLLDSNGTVIASAGKVADGVPYGITVYQQPTGKTCSVSNGVGVVAAADVTNVQVDCI
jgi:hypothetical protein